MWEDDHNERGLCRMVPNDDFIWGYRDMNLLSTQAWHHPALRWRADSASRTIPVLRCSSAIPARLGSGPQTPPPSNNATHTPDYPSNASTSAAAHKTPTPNTRHTNNTQRIQTTLSEYQRMAFELRTCLSQDPTTPDTRTPECEVGSEGSGHGGTTGTALTQRPGTAATQWASGGNSVVTDATTRHGRDSMG